MNDFTLNYYNENAERFVQDTVNAKMTDIQELFLSCVKPGGYILDLGCGSGRDSLSFLKAGYRVQMVDGSVKLAEAAQALTGLPVHVARFQDFRTEEIFDGIWACASLLHLTKEDIHSVVKKLTGNLGENAVFYMSFKYGTYSGERNGRFFTDLTEADIDALLSNIPDLRLIETRITADVRVGREQQKWLNVFCKKVDTPDL